MSAAVLIRPTYNNLALASFPRWFEDNKRALIRWWWQCDSALRIGGGPVAADPDDFEQFCRCQHDREVKEASA